jgi:hypothetical protein
MEHFMSHYDEFETSNEMNRRASKLASLRPEFSALSIANGIKSVSLMGDLKKRVLRNAVSENCKTCKIGPPQISGSIKTRTKSFGTHHKGTN